MTRNSVSSKETRKSGKTGKSAPKPSTGKRIGKSKPEKADNQRNRIVK